MKKFLKCICALVGILLFAVTAFAGECDTYAGSNENANDYALWASTVKSNLYDCNDGRLMRVQYLADKNSILVEYYNDSFERIANKTVSLKYPVYGGFYGVGDYYFVLTGQNNYEESSSVVCFAVTKYDKNWSEVGSATLRDCNTTVPFRAGSARFCHSGNYLIIRTCHEMYKSSDGNNHQANVTIQLDMNSMAVTDNFTKVATTNYGYVSHSFNQFVRVDSDHIVAVDHGDAYPRSIVFLKYKTSVSSGKFVPAYNKPCSAVDVFEISGAIGNNITGCSVGGFEISSDGYLICFNSVLQGTDSEVKDIYVSYLPANGTVTENRKLTSYSSRGASTPTLVKISNNRFMLMWSYGGKVNYCTLDGKGNLTSDILSFEGSLSDCQPIVHSGNILWYVWKGEKTTFYTISTSDISEYSIKSFIAAHSYDVAGVNGTSANLVCSKCGNKKSGKIPSYFQLYWQIPSSSDGMGITYSSQNASYYHPDRTVRLKAYHESADLNEYDVISSDESVAKIIRDNEILALKTLGEGTVKVTIRSKYNPEVKTQYTLKVSHDWTVKQTVEATCTSQGITVKKCSFCNEEKTEITAASGHDMSEYSVVKEATCKALGKKEATCRRCDYKLLEDIPKKDHDRNIKTDAVSPTCTKQGKTSGNKCSMCGKATVEQESIPALGHDLGEYKITKKPTCTAQGEETAKCIRCSYTKTQSVARIAHTEVSVKAVDPTCTKQGKTAGKKCSVCDKITVEQESVPALGHELGEYEITKESTCSAKGEKTASCIRCSYSKTSDIPKLEHVEKTLKAVKATCTKAGKTQGKKCSLCGKIIVAQESVAATGHSKKTVVLTKATTKANGKIETNCETCGKSFGENRVYRIQSVTLSKTKYTCDGKAKTPQVTVTDYNKDQLIKGKDYTVTYQKGRKAVGKYAVTVKFKGKYSGKVTLYFEIKLAKVAKLTATAGNKSVSLKWDAVKGADGYQVYYSEKENGSYKKLTGSKKTSIKNTQLKSGKKYYFKVRAYKKTDNGTVYGEFSKIKPAKIK